MKLLIDECLHTSLVEVAHAAGYVADHVNYLGLGSSKDWQLMATVRAKDYTFVTNNIHELIHRTIPLLSDFMNALAKAIQDETCVSLPACFCLD